MKTLELDEISLRKGWGGIDEYWFSLNDYTIKEAAELAHLERPEQISQNAYFVSLGYIPYFSVSTEEVIRAFIPTIKNKKLCEVLSGMNCENYVEQFWKYFHIYREIQDDYQAFEIDYVKQKAASWCKDNAIEYVIK